MKHSLKKILLTCLLFQTLIAVAAPNQINKVIYITLDGVRWQDVFQDKRHFNKFWEKYANKVELYGEPGSANTMEVASVPISQPSYLSQMLGKVTECQNNQCERTTEETLPEIILNRTGNSPEDVAVFASWPTICLTIEREAGEVQSDCGDQFGSTRSDKETLAATHTYLENNHPKFLWISLNDADDAAHHNDKTTYLNALDLYDDLIDRLIQHLKAKREYEHTAIFITTDHGRGNGDNWTSHGPQFPESKQTFAFVFNSALVPDQASKTPSHYSTLSIKPSILQHF